MYVYICYSLTNPSAVTGMYQKLNKYTYVELLPLENGNFVEDFPWRQLDQIIKSIRVWGSPWSAILWQVRMQSTQCNQPSVSELSSETCDPDPHQFDEMNL